MLYKKLRTNILTVVYSYC